MWKNATWKGLGSLGVLAAYSFAVAMYGLITTAQWRWVILEVLKALIVVFVLLAQYRQLNREQTEHSNATLAGKLLHVSTALLLASNIFSDIIIWQLCRSIGLFSSR